MNDQLTKTDIKLIEEEIENRKLVVRKEALEAVKEARAQGDLSDNFEYYAARRDKNINEGRIRYFERMIRSAVIISDESLIDEIGLSNTVEIYFEEDNITEYPKDQENKLIEMITNIDEQGALQAFSKIYNWVFENYKSSYKEGKCKLIELMLNIDRMVINFSIRDENKSYLFNMNSIEEYLLLESLCREKIRQIIVNISEFQKKKINRLIVNAKLFIDENFTDEITLEDVSKVVCVSPQYFSRLFKEETSQNFIEYLTRVRINRAKELMRGSNLSIKEICFKTGYADPNYFSHIFKKTEKLTPSEYIKKCNKG